MSYAYRKEQPAAAAMATGAMLHYDARGKYQDTKTSYISRHRTKEGLKETVYRAVKRSFDISAAMAALIITLPVWLICPLLIKLGDGGSVFFVQERVGLSGKAFKMIKFRSMREGAEKQKESLGITAIKAKAKKDPRVTKIGAFMRKTSIDELPQLINIIKGDMSVVGPRPLIPAEQKHCTGGQRKRLTAKPGLVCIRELRGRSDVTDFDEWMEMDLEYINSRSTLTDMRIFFMSIPVVLSGKGAC